MSTVDDQFADASDESVEGFFSSPQPPSLPIKIALGLLSSSESAQALTSAALPPTVHKRVVDTSQLETVVPMTNWKKPGLRIDNSSLIATKRKWPDDRKSSLGSVPISIKRKKLSRGKVGITPPMVRSSITGQPFDNRNGKNKVVETKESYLNCIPTHQVEMASRLVGQMLRHWPESSPGMHLQAAVTIEKFGRQVFLPYIVTHLNHSELNKKKTMNHDRIFYATLLAFREVLAQNASTFFAVPSFGGKPGTLYPSKDNKNREIFVKLMMATTIVMHACEAAGRNTKLLLDLIENDNFPEAKPFGKLLSPNGRVKGMEESLAWKVGFNLAQRERRKAFLPTPTSCWIFIVESIPEYDKAKAAPSDLF